LSLDASVSGVTIDMVEAAASRIRGYVRRTPMIEVVQVRDAPTRNPLYLKLESLQVTGAFKARGAMNRLLTTPAEALKRGIVTASGGNHGVAVARLLIPEEAAPQFRDDVAPRNGMMPPPDSEMIAPPITE
jgi:threonine dehydratase